ncbi:DNA adenine methylase [Edwardsiella tarda]|nr:DNA adenine methylase [Edwardsiella tarda]
MSVMKTPLKWAGSKARIMDTLRQHLPYAVRLVEPFAGSCSVMMNTDYPEYLVADVNPDLIGMYQHIVRDVDGFIERTRHLFEMFNSEDGYYDSRDSFNHDNDPDRRGPLFLYLNRHCFNGLCRYNRSGHFNVPFGHYKKPYFPEEELRAFAEKASCATFLCCHYAETLSMVRPGDVVYCDPPYLTDSCEFTAYHSTAFSHIEHGQLARKLRRVASSGVSVVVSNSDTDLVRHLYRDFECHGITAPRSIGASAGSKKNARELIITSPLDNVQFAFDPAKPGADCAVIHEVRA